MVGSYNNVEEDGSCWLAGSYIAVGSRCEGQEAVYVVRNREAQVQRGCRRGGAFLFGGSNALVVK